MSHPPSALAAQSPNASQFTIHPGTPLGAPHASQFAPRREFIRDQHTFSSFTLLALSGTSSVRLYSFPQPLIASFRHFFQQSKLTSAFREDSEQNLCEFTLEGRPWAIAKSVKTEKLIIDLLTLVFRHGYIFLSTIDYGREQDDRLALAFSKPAMMPGSGSRSGSPLPGAISAAPPPPLRTLRVPFAISFSSPTIMRVINPPLNSTPAILQAVRGSWPRGVVAEKKIAETSFEFKLKGYKWFQEDTFATDSLRHILTLLAALDVHGFKLLSSLTLTNRSRIKDLWVFTGPSAEGVSLESPPASPHDSSLELRRQETPESGGGIGPRHMRSSSAPFGSSTTLTSAMGGHQHGASHANHARHATEGSLQVPPSPSTSGPPPSGVQAPRAVLRKPSPKAPAVAFASSSSGSLARSPLGSVPSEPIRASLASEIGSAENMTGVGIARLRFHSDPDEPAYLHQQRGEIQRPRMPVTEVIYETGGEQSSRETTPSAFMAEEDPFRREVPPTTGRALPTPPTMPHRNNTEQSPPPPMFNPSAEAPVGRHTPPEPPRAPSPRTAHSSTLLSPGLFRDSAFTTSTGWRSTEIPITWTGQGERDSELGAHSGHDSGVGIMVGPRERERMAAAGITPGPKVPGGWMLTPVDERADDPMASQTRLVSPPAPVGPRAPGDGAANGYAQHMPPAPPAATGWEFGPRARTPEKHKVDARVSSPAVVAYPPSGLARKSEAGVVGVMPVAAAPLRMPLPSPPPTARLPAQRRVTPPPPPPPPPAPVFPSTEPARASEGWVLVDVDTKDRAHAHAHGSGYPQRPPNRPRSTSDSLVNARASPVLHAPGGAKATLTVAAVDAIKGAQRSDSSASHTSGLRRLFSLSKQDTPSPGKKGHRQSYGEGGLAKYGSVDDVRTGHGVFGRRKQHPPPEPVRQRIKLD